MRKYFAVLAGGLLVLSISGCAKVLLVNEKEATEAIAEAETNYRTADDADVDLPKLLNRAEDGLEDAKYAYNRDHFTEALELAKIANQNAKDALNLPKEAKAAIDEGDKKLSMGREASVDIYAPEDFKSASVNLKEAHERFDRKIYQEARDLALLATNVMQKAFEDVDKINNAITSAKTALVNAKEAKADEKVPEQYNDARETLGEAQSLMEERKLPDAIAKAEEAKKKAEKASQSAREKQ